MLRPILWATMAVATVFASGDFVVLHSPDTVLFVDKGEVDQSLLKEIFSAALGITLKQKAFWNGMNITGPFPLPEAVVGIAVDGEHLESPRGKKFTMNFDESEETTWQALSGRLEKRKNNNTLRISVGDGVIALGQSSLGKLETTSINNSTLKSLDINVDKDLEILQEIKLLHAIADKVRTTVTADGIPDVFWLAVPGMQPLIALHGKDSPAVKEAFVLLNDALHDVSEAFMNAYKNNVLIAAFTNDANEVRNVRSASLVRERREDSKSSRGDSDINVKAPENPSTTPAIESIKNDEEKSEKNETAEEVKTTTSDEGSSLIKSDESHSLNENNETRTENKEAEANEPRESSTMTSSLDLDNTTRNNEHSNTDTENTNSPLKIGDLNLAKKYSESYPVIFNIILWFGVAFFFSLLAICIAIADMDPGRDSIIYRMTSNRMKKDN